MAQLDDTKINEEVRQYLQTIEEYRLPEPDRGSERLFLRTSNLARSNLLDTYGVYAAHMAEAWYGRNSGQEPSFDEAVRAANRGMLRAYYHFINEQSERLPRFRHYARRYMRAELIALFQKASATQLHGL